MLGIIMAAVAGAAMSIQGVFNTALGEKTGLFETNAFVQGTAFVLSLAVAFFFGKGDITKITQAPKLYWTGGVFAVAITATVMLAMKSLKPAYAVSVILIAQLLVAAVIDAFGLFGIEKAAFSWNKYLGLFLMIGGVIVFKLELGK